MIIDKISFEQGVACFYSSFVNTAKYFNDSFREETAFLKCNGMKFETNIDKISSLSAVVLSHRLNEIVLDFLDMYSIKNEYIVFSGYDELYDFIIDNLDNKKPVIVKANSKMLRHSPVYYENKNRNHTLVILGYNLNDKSFLFFDSFIPTFPAESTQGKVSFCDLGKICVDNRVFFFDSDSLKTLDFSFEYDEYRLCLEKNIDLYFSSLEQLILVSNYLNNLYDYFSEEDIQTHLSEISYNITFNGIIPSRSILKNICNRLGFSELYAEWQNLITEWYSLSLLLVKYSFSPNHTKLEKNQIVHNVVFLSNLWYTCYHEEGVR